MFRGKYVILELKITLNYEFHLLTNWKFQPDKLVSKSKEMLPTWKFQVKSPSKIIHRVSKFIYEWNSLMILLPL